MPSAHRAAASARLGGAAGRPAPAMREVSSRRWAPGRSPASIATPGGRGRGAGRAAALSGRAWVETHEAPALMVVRSAKRRTMATFLAQFAFFVTYPHTVTPTLPKRERRLPARNAEFGLVQPLAQRLVHLAGGEPVLRQGRHAGGSRPAPRPLRAGPRVGLVEVEGGEPLVELLQGGDQPEGAAGLGADLVSLEVPGDVLAQLPQGPVLLAHVLTQEDGVLADGAGHGGQPGADAPIRAGEGGGEVGEQPGPALAPAPNDDAVAPGVLDHAHGVLGGPDVPVAEHRDGRDVPLEGGDGVPVGRAGVVLGGGAGVEGDPGDAEVLGLAARVEVGEVIVVDAHAHLDRHRHVEGAGGPDRGGEDLAEELVFPRQGRASALAGDL